MSGRVDKYTLWSSNPFKPVRSHFQFHRSNWLMEWTFRKPLRLKTGILLNACKCNDVWISLPACPNTAPACYVLSNSQAENTRTHTIWKWSYTYPLVLFVSVFSSQAILTDCSSFTYQFLRNEFLWKTEVWPMSQISLWSNLILFIVVQIYDTHFDLLKT